ncbi:MAG: hypothetical protein QM572_15640 [Nocardioides sp.]|uniref:hypothetical protein n=1 Tax=Nocardioides sp. TaxID=35761 RepID=UPI0039E684DC
MNASPKHLLLPAAIVGGSLILAVGGTGAADAAKLINGKLIKTGTVASKQIKDGSITSADLAASAKVPGPTGPAGPAGAAGAPGADGADATTGYEVVSGITASVADGAQASLLVWCPVGKVAVGGGGTWSGGASNAAGWLATNNPLRAIRDSNGNLTGNGFPSTTVADGWAISGTNKAGGARDLRGWVICVSVG